MKAEDKHLLQKFMDGHCSEKELAEVKLLLEQPDAHELLDEMITMQSWEEWNTLIEPDQGILDLTAKKKAEAAERFRANEQTYPVLKEIRPIRKLRFLRYAAIWAGLLLTGSLAVWQYNKIRGQHEQLSYIEKINPKGMPMRYVLPDSSEVFVGAGSKLRYPEHFVGKTREIELQGEAFFQVKHDAEKPFIIHTANIQTQVLGTSFKVEAFRGEPIVVSVATGKVGVSHQNNKTSKTLALLTPGRQVIWDNQMQQATERAIDVYSLVNWKTGDLTFEDQSVAKITHELERRFALKIDIIDNEVAGNMVSVTFPATKPIDKIMHILSETGRFKYETTDSRSFKIYKLK